LRCHAFQYPDGLLIVVETRQAFCGTAGEGGGCLPRQATVLEQLREALGVLILDRDGYLAEGLLGAFVLRVGEPNHFLAHGLPDHGVQQAQ